MVLCDVYKGRYGRPRTATSPASSAKVLEQFTRWPQKSTKQCALETGVSIFKTARWKVFIPRLLHALNEDDPDRRVQYCEWFQNMVREDEEFMGKMIWSDEAQFKLNGTVNRHNCVLGSRKIHTFMWKKKSFTGPQRLVWSVIKGANCTVLF